MNFDQLLIEEAKKYIGIKEDSYNDGPMIREFQKAVDGKANRESWCLAYVFYCIKKVEEKTNRKSWLWKSEHCMTTFTKSPREARTPHPEIGSLCIWQYYSPKGVATGSGHVGIVSDVISATQFETIEGNTSNSQAVERNGDGVYMKKRRMAKVGSMRVMGFLRPWMVDPE